VIATVALLRRLGFPDLTEEAVARYLRRQR
jgi:hypothetical protein